MFYNLISILDKSITVDESQLCGLPDVLSNEISDRSYVLADSHSKMVCS